MSGGQHTEGGPLPRFYDLATVSQTGEADWHILLDGRTVKTPQRAALLLPSEALAIAIASEWNAQSETIDLRLMPLTKLANTALDGVCGREGDVIADILSYAGRDTICYYADAPAELVDRQKAAWKPVLQWATEALAAPLITATGIMPVEQATSSLASLRQAIERFTPFRLTALHTMTSLTGSAVLVLAHIFERLSVEECWSAAHIDENYQIEQWGEDSEAKAQRASRLAEMHAASKFYFLASR
jgi:chaperone required for assembly of F1-ATPase